MVNIGKIENPYTVAKKILYIHSSYLYILADAKYYVPIKLMYTRRNPKDFTVRNTLEKNNIKLIKLLIWDTLDINWT